MIGFWFAYMGIDGGGAVSVVIPSVPGAEAALGSDRSHSKVADDRSHSKVTEE